MFDKKVVFLVSSALLITTGLATGYYFYNEQVDENKNIYISQKEIASNIGNSISFGANNKTSENVLKPILTTQNTSIIYEYYYKDSKTTKRQEKKIPEELANKNKKTIENVFDDWKLVYFSPEKIILKKELNNISETDDYVLKEYDGFVAVFYADGTTQELKEITKTPIKSLPEDEQNLLKTGINVHGNENLLKTLQDYES